MNSKQLKEISANLLRTVEEMQKHNDIVMITISYGDKTSCGFIPSEYGNYSTVISELIAAAKYEAEQYENIAREIEKSEDPQQFVDAEFNEKIIAANNSIKSGDYLSGINLLKEASELNETHSEAINKRINDLQQNIITGI